MYYFLVGCAMRFVTNWGLFLLWSHLNWSVHSFSSIPFLFLVKFQSMPLFNWLYLSNHHLYYFRFPFSATVSKSCKASQIIDSPRCRGDVAVPNYVQAVTQFCNLNLLDLFLCHCPVEGFKNIHWLYNPYFINTNDIN